MNSISDHADSRLEHNALTLHFQSSLVGTRGLLTVQHRVASTMDTNYSSKLYICIYIIDSHVVIHIQLYMMTTYLRILEISKIYESSISTRVVCIDSL